MYCVNRFHPLQTLESNSTLIEDSIYSNIDSSTNATGVNGNKELTMHGKASKT